jgi:hypothetical protein
MYSTVSWYQHFDKELTNAFAKNDYVLITGFFIEILKISVSNYSMLINTWFALIAFTIFYNSPNGTKKNLPTYVSKGIIIMV